MCSTDILSVELVIKEIVAQMRHQLKKGCNLRMMFKVGKLLSSNNEITWKSFRDDDRIGRSSNLADGATHASSSLSRAMVNSTRRKDLSVMTPSVAKTRTSSHVSTELRSFHISNPNPQQFSMKFKRVRDIGYKNYEKHIDPTDIVKFGKKVDYDIKMSSDQMMQEHLRQIREKNDMSKLNQEIKRRQEREYLSNIKQLEEQEAKR